jgi:uncharacterized protein YabE (DUF348 family)
VIHNEDTQPTTSFKPISPTKRPTKNRLPILLFIMLIGLSLTLSVGWFLLSLVVDNAPAQVEPSRIVLQADGQIRTITTSARTVQEVLMEQGIAVSDADLIIPPLESPLSITSRITIERARPVEIRVDDSLHSLLTTYESPYDILRSAEVTVSQYDIVLVDDQPIDPAELIAWPLPVQSIQIIRALPIIIYDGDEQIPLNSVSDTVGEALFEAGIELFVSDTVEPSVNTPLYANLEINIDRSRSVVILADGRRIETRVNAQSVGGALAESGIALNGLDYSIPDENNALVANTTIRVIRVTEDLITHEETLPYETVYQADAEMRLDTRAVLQVGQEGLYQRTERVRYENGVEVSRITEDEGVVRVPQNQVVAYGTQIVIRTIDTPDGPVEYWRQLRMYATSYHPGSVGGSTRTSIGETLRKGIIGINPNIISYRTNMYVPGYGRGFAADTGGPRRSPYWVDLGYSDEDWVGWSRWVDVYLLLPVPDNVDYLLPASINEGGPR